MFRVGARPWFTRLAHHERAEDRVHAGECRSGEERQARADVPQRDADRGAEDRRQVDLVVEAVPERLDLKQRLLAALDQACKPDAILATNTSSISVTRLASTTDRPERFIGLHFMNSPATARNGNLISAGGMTVAVIATFVYLLLRDCPHGSCAVGGLSTEALIIIIAGLQAMF